MSQLLLIRNYHDSYRTPRRRQPVAIPFRAGKFFLMFSMVILGGIISMLYLMHFTDIHTKGYTLKKLELTRAELQNQRAIKVMNVAKVRSLSHIQGSEIVSKMTPLRNPIYLKSGAQVAKKE